jgi:MFS family permease
VSQALPSGPAAPTITTKHVDRVGAGFLVAYCLAHFGALLAIFTPTLVTLAIRVAQIDRVHKVHNLSVILGAGAVVGLVAHPFFGRLSDRTTSRFGMRRPWLVGGALVGTSGTLVIALAHSIRLILVGNCLAHLGFTALIAALSALLVDQIPSAQRGRVSGLLGASHALAQVAGAYVVEFSAGSTFWMFMFPAVVGLVIVLVLAAVLHDRRLDATERPPYTVAEFLRTFWVNPVRHPDFGWAWLSRFLFFMGVAMFFTYRVYYLTDHLHRSLADIPRLIVVVTIVQKVFLIIGSGLSGWLSDLTKRRKVFVLVSGIAFGVSLLGTAFGNSLHAFLIGIGVASLAQGVYLAVDLALVTGVLPGDKADTAKNLGVFSIASHLPVSLAPAIAAAILATGGGGNYSALFFTGGVCATVGAFAIQPVRRVR